MNHSTENQALSGNEIFDTFTTRVLTPLQGAVALELFNALKFTDRVNHEDGNITDLAGMFVALMMDIEGGHDA